MAVLELWKQGSVLVKFWVETQKFISGPQAPRGCCSAAGLVRGLTPRGLRRRCGALRAQALRGLTVRTAGLLPCFGFLAQKCDLKRVLSRFWLVLVLWHPGKHFKASGTCIWIKWLRIPFYFMIRWLSVKLNVSILRICIHTFHCLDRGKKTFNMHASHIRICMSV